MRAVEELIPVPMEAKREFRKVFMFINLIPWKKGKSGNGIHTNP
jgi:hypothetical protein